MGVLRYIGQRMSTGEPTQSLIYDGIPAGDVDDEQLSKEQVKIALSSGLYERESVKAAAKTKED